MQWNNETMKEARQKAKLSQTTLADKLGYTFEQFKTGRMVQLPFLQ